MDWLVVCLTEWGGGGGGDTRGHEEAQTSRSEALSHEHVPLQAEGHAYQRTFIAQQAKGGGIKSSEESPSPILSAIFLGNLPLAQRRVAEMNNLYLIVWLC
jgi:hypothetical protein